MIKKTVLITGVAQGLGKYLAEKFSSIDYYVIGLDIKNNNELDIVLIENINRYYCFDLNKIDKISGLIKKIIYENHQIDILINNAGIKYFNVFNEIESKIIEKVFTINIIAPIKLIKELLPEMLKRKSGKIINISSNAAIRGYSKGSLYCSSKSALMKFSQALSEEIEHSGVSILTLCPSTLSTNEYLNKYPDISKKNLIAPERIFKIIKHEINLSRNKTLLITTRKKRLKYIIKYIILLLPGFITKGEL